MYELAIVVLCIYIAFYFIPAVFGVRKIELIFLASVKIKKKIKKMKKYDTRIACFPGTTATAIALCIIIKYVHGRRTVERFIVVAKKRRLYNIYI
jgi:hypothetical protein